METARFWTRVGHWFKRSAAPTDYDGEAAATAPHEGESSPDLRTPIGDHTPLVEQRWRPMTQFRLSRSRSDPQRLEQEYARVVSLIDVIQKHLGSQAERWEVMARSLDRLAESLAHAP